MPEFRESADFFRPRLAEMSDLRHPLAELASGCMSATLECV